MRLENVGRWRLNRMHTLILALAIFGAFSLILDIASICVILRWLTKPTTHAKAATQPFTPAQETQTQPEPTNVGGQPAP